LGLHMMRVERNFGPGWQVVSTYDLPKSSIGKVALGVRATLFQVPKIPLSCRYQIYRDAPSIIGRADAPYGVDRDLARSIS
jgi:hypothetical protein